MKTIRGWWAFAALAALAGCSGFAPAYTRPETPVPQAWPGGAPPAEEARAAADIPWSEFFLDAQLREVVALALENNRDLRVALLRVEQSRSRFQIQDAALLPKVEAGAGANFQRVPEDFSAAGRPVDLHQYNVGLGVTAYELDLFGRVRSLKAQALERYLATGHAQRAVRIGLVSQVAAAWLTLAADRERLQLARETVASREESLGLARARFEAGVASALDLQQARTAVEAARVDIALFATLAAQAENALSLAVGATVPAGLLPQAIPGETAALAQVAPGLSSDVLLRRPDILQAESRLKEVNANVGAARAALFPRITLVSSVGLGSDELGGLLGGGATSWRFAPQISFPIFDGGANRANLKATEVEREIAVAQYEQAIQAAFREVADALARRGTIDEQLAAQESLAEAAAESLRLSRARFDKGVDSYLAVLDSQRSLSGARQGLITARLSRLANLATLYKVLGGGAGE